MKPKRLPRLWCALQGLLPLEACIAAQRGELAWPPEKTDPTAVAPLEAGLEKPPEAVGNTQARRCTR